MCLIRVSLIISRLLRFVGDTNRLSSFIILVTIQNALWNCSAHSSDHFPGKLSLCLGMLVMIRNNDATELCITKGQEAYVAD